MEFRLHFCGNIVLCLTTGMSLDVQTSDHDERYQTISVSYSKHSVRIRKQLIEICPLYFKVAQ